ncbi:uncharacterized protein LOC128985498 isoform X2 [Macrosteles quadrilineatus]|uniref:uncharacterized protein LOC128985498 isoform X2 n=1 Tax=Macrosteles quadrilineatus TaxID=74068 RepID=UPI0023E0B261|nr:uncharacterized protein LOC128985498 isoform X2 [Macrosteles quadrilineatus]
MMKLGCTELNEEASMVTISLLSRQIIITHQDTKLADYSTTPISTNQGKIFSSFTASDKASVSRVFKLDIPFTNSPFDRKRHDSEISNGSFIPSLDSQFDKNEAMTDSMVNFLEKSNENCKPPVGFQDEKLMTESLVSLSEKEGCQGFSEEVMTDSMVSFLDPVTCKPPSGFEDEEVGMGNSIVNIDEKDILPSSDMTNSLMDYIESGNTTSTSQRPNLNETENIPPGRLNLRKEESISRSHRECATDGKSGRKCNTTFELKESSDTTFNIEEGSEKSPEVTFTNSVNISRTNKKDNIETKDDFKRPLNMTFEKENDAIHISRALNNKDLNVTHDLNDEDIKEFNTSKFKIPKTNSLMNHSRLNGTFTRSTNDNSVRLNGTFTKNDIDSSLLNGTLAKKIVNNTSNLSRKIPQRNSTFNTTFTKLDFPASDLLHQAISSSTECLETGVEDDRTSSASDSSFSSAASSNKPRSMNELRSIAQQQESSLVQSSTPTEVLNIKSKNFAQLDLELSPIRRASLDGRRVSESRSAHCSPVRSPLPHSPRPHPISRLQQPIIEARRQTLQASSLSNLTLTKPRASGLRMPSKLVRPDPRPITAPVAAPTAIPRPQASRLPMPRFRTSGIPTMKRGGH